MDEGLNNETNEEIKRLADEVILFIKAKMSEEAKQKYSETNIIINTLCTSLVFIAVKSLTKDEDNIFMQMLYAQIYTSIKLNRE